MVCTEQCNNSAGEFSKQTIVSARYDTLRRIKAALVWKQTIASARYDVMIRISAAACLNQTIVSTCYTSLQLTCA